MRLYLARHGQAASPEPGVTASLTAQGKADLALVAQALANRKLGLQQIWHSPKTRARQTAEIYASVLKLDPSNLLEKKSLSIDNEDVDLLYGEILESKLESLLLVSHQPLLEKLASFLVSDAEPVFFPTAGVAAFGEAPRWKKLWLLEPSALK